MVEQVKQAVVTVKSSEGVGMRFVKAVSFARGFVLVLAGLAGGAQAALPIESWSLASGGRVMFMRAPAIPMVDIQVDFDAGSRREPPEKNGLASFTQSMLDKGAGGRKESDIEDALADVGARMGGGSGADRASFNLRTLTSAQELNRAVETLALVLQKPDFPADVLERERARSIASIREASTKPESIANKRFMALMYPGHPYGRSATEETVGRIAVEDLKRFYAENYTAKRAVVSIVGDLDRTQASRIAEQLLAGLPAGVEPPALPALQMPAQVEERIAHPSSQSHILVGLPALQRGDPDFFPLVVGNYILGGGGFVSRLMSEVREKRGLAYSAYAYFSPMVQLGPFEMGLQTQKDQTNTALAVARETLNKFLQDGPTPKELQAAKSNLVGGFPLRLDSNKKLLDQISTIGYYRLPEDYLDQWTAQVEKVTIAQIRDAFSRRVKPEHLVTVIVGQGS
jgi:zinc protease